MTMSLPPVSISLCYLLLGAVDVPKRPFAAIVGGSKVSSKISVIEAMLSKVSASLNIKFISGLIS